MSAPLLSIIIVNYKVAHFLEQCLLSVQRASAGIQAEVIVVDNASCDGSIEILAPRFPQVRFISSDQNLGFARASNRGYRESRGEYVLFLNPDTLLSEESLGQPIEFLRAHPQAGALGIKMIDGSGKFLRESKRAFPDPLTAFYKIIGLSRLFPRSRHFARYHLGHLSPDENQIIDVVSGAYFLVKRTVLENAGVFDEQFFMYGEDIDLSYRIQQAGYVNYYFAETPIIHFKGESTQKQGLKYVTRFYGAMSQFVSKHRLHSGWFRLGIQVSIGMRALLSVLQRVIRVVGIPTIDSLLILMCFLTVRNFWSMYVRPEVVYPSSSLLAFALQALVFFLTGLFTGLYRKPFRWAHFLRATAYSAAFLLAAYSLLPENLRYSRGIVTISSLLSIFILAAWRVMLLYLQLISTSKGPGVQFPLLVVGSTDACSEVRSLYPEKLPAAFLHIDPSMLNGTLSDKIKSLKSIIPFTDIVFCPGALPFSKALTIMQSWSGRFSFHFHLEGSRGVICSNCIASPNDVHAYKR